MLREPIQSIVSFPFYRQVPQKSFAAASGYIAYLGLLFAAAVVLAIFVHLHPKIDAAADWASAALPRVVLDGGKLTSIPPDRGKCATPRSRTWPSSSTWTGRSRFPSRR